MTCNISAHPVAVFRRASMRPIVGTLGMFLFREAMRSLFLHRVLHLTPGYLLQLLPRHQLLLKIHTFRKSDPFCANDKKGKRDFMELSRSFLFSYLYLCTFLCGQVVFGVWTCVFIVVLILWFGTCFEVGMSLCMDKFLL